jgi:hypothetical protein
METPIGVDASPWRGAPIDAILAAPTLDSWRVAPGDSFAFDADVLNPLST